MTAPRGIGKGTNSGGKNPGAGRPRGSRNRRSAALITEAEAAGQLPVAFLLQCMRDRELPLAQRIACANAAAPYTSARLTTLPAFTNPDHLDDTALTSQNTRLEQYVAKIPQGDLAAAATTQVEKLLEELPQLPHRSQESLLGKLIAAGEAGLQRLNDPNRPGAVPRRPDDDQRQPAPSPAERVRRPGSAPASEPGSTPASEPEGPAAPPNGRRLRYDPSTGRLESVS
jgi:hypothetical protein